MKAVLVLRVPVRVAVVVHQPVGHPAPVVVLLFLVILRLFGTVFSKYLPLTFTQEKEKSNPPKKVIAITSHPLQILRHMLLLALEILTLFTLILNLIRIRCILT